MGTIQIFPSTTIYVACLRNHATGGPEVLHQLVYQLNQQGFKAKMLYYPTAPPSHDPVHAFYKIYNNPFSYEVEDIAENLVIVPEIITEISLKFKKVRTAIWWLSIDFHYHRYRKKKLRFREFLGLMKFFRFDKPSTHPDFHLSQSYYAIDHLHRKGIRDVLYLSDYLNPAFTSRAPQTVERLDTVLYNPKKGAAFTKKIIDASPELQWQPIINLTPAQVSDLLQTRKVYIDFGNHPGKDRFPREAAISGCCVITGKNGAAGFDQDVPILEKYKFEATDENIPAIVSAIKMCLQNYAQEERNFERYRNMIRNEPADFVRCIQQIFVRPSQN